MMRTKQEQTEFEVAYNAKDLILYGLSIGVGSDQYDNNDDDNELRFLYENHPLFCPIPTFCLAFMFWARERKREADSKTSCDGIPSFPPPLMTREDVIPSRFLREKVDLSSYPVIHTWQSVVFHQSMPTPPLHKDSSRCDCVARTRIGLQTISVLPKSIGTFVTTQSQVVSVTGNEKNKRSLICTMQSTALIFGISSDHVIPFKSSRIPKSTLRIDIPKNKPALFEWTYKTLPTQALLYRLGSGDSNKIHVDDSASKMLGTNRKAPLLHGLFTLAVAFRGISKLVGSAEERIQRLEGKFTHPGFVGDTLMVKIWADENNSSSRFLFIVTNQETGAILINCGVAEMKRRSKTSDREIASKL
jgi:acyl dehydratase